MAIVTRELPGFGDAASGYGRWELDYDDATMFATTFRCVNPTTKPACAIVRRAGNVIATPTFPAQQTTEIALPTNPAQRLNVTLVKGGAAIDGFDANLNWPC